MSLIQDFKEAIELQQKKAESNFEEQIQLPLSERVAKGITMTGLRVEFEFHDSAPNKWVPQIPDGQKFIAKARIYSKNNISKFREGASVYLSNGNHRFPMEIIEDEVNEFILAPNSFDVKHCYLEVVHNKNNWEINVKKSNITLKLFQATYEHLINKELKSAEIEAILNGTFNCKRVENFHYTKLNDSQNKAIENAISSNRFHLIQGPPGTGKTETIAHLAKTYAEQGKKIFISGPTHAAINNSLNAISRQVQDASKVVKIGQKYQASELSKNENITKRERLPWANYMVDKYLSQQGIIIGGTAFCMCYPASKRLNNWEFDVAIIDEAAQMSIPLAIAVMSKSSQFIFVGDHKQLAPIIPKNTGNILFDGSVFEKLINLYPTNSSLLNISYRLNEHLIRIPNQLFYSNELVSSPIKKIDATRYKSTDYSDILNSKDSIVLYLHKEFDALGRSVYEAQIVAALIKDLISNDIQINEIAVLTPYRAQVREVKKQVKKLIESFPIKDLFVDTVDRMQGQEKKYIIYTMSNSHPLQSKRRLDFFYSPNRLNVAITRAINKCIVIANYKVFDIIDEELKELDSYEKLQPSLTAFKAFKSISTIIEEMKNEEDDW